MLNTGKLAGLTVFITGASRGIGKAIALKCARDGANVVIAAKTGDPHPKLPGTIYSAAEEVEKAGGKALPCLVDIRHEEQVLSAVEQAVQRFGGIDILVNNASAISLTDTPSTTMKKYDLMNSVNTRGTFLCSKACLPHLKNSKFPQILTLSSPLNMSPVWFKSHVAYTIAKYGMSMCVLGMAEEFKPYGIGVNALWPKTAIHTAATEMLAGDSMNIRDHSRSPDIMSDAAYVALTRDPRQFTGNFYIDEELLREVGVTDFDRYAMRPGAELYPDLFIGDGPPAPSPDINAPTGVSANVPASSDSGPVAGVFNEVSALVSPEMVKKIGSVYLFELSDTSEKWFIDLKNSGGSVGRGDPPPGALPDVTMNLKSADFVAMFSGKLKPTMAFMTGRLKISGDMGMALKLEKLMKKHQQAKL